MYHDFLFVFFSFLPFMFLYSYNSFNAVVVCVIVYLTYALINICLFDAHMAPTLFCTQ